MASFLFNMILFFVLTPGVLLSLPPGASLQTKALTHAVVFAVAVCCLGPMMKKYVR